MILHAAQSHAEPVAEGLTAYRNRLAHRAESKFSYLGPASVAAGMARLSVAAEREDGAAPVYERYDVIVFDRAPGRGAGR